MKSALSFKFGILLVRNGFEPSQMAVPTAKGRALADEYGIKFFEASAKTNLNVEEVFFSRQGHKANSDTTREYYYEPGTGRKFRSLLSVQRHLTGNEEPTRWRKQSNCIVPFHNSGTLRRVIYGGKVLTLDELEARYTKLEDIYPETAQFKMASTLPDGLIVEDVPRRCGSTRVRYYIDPKTGNKFRSIPEVHKYLEPQRYEPNSKALTLSNCSTAPRSTLLKDTSTNMVKNGIFDLMNPPEKINWVYGGDGKDNWNPLVDECVLPDYVKEQWSETFLLGMNGWKHHVPQLTM